MAITAQLFDGTNLEFPDGTDQSVIDKTVKQETLARNTKQDTGFTGAFKSSLEKLKGEAALTAGKIGLMDEDEAEQYHKSQEDLAKRVYKPTEEDWFHAPVTKFKELLGGSLPYIAAPVAAAGTALFLPEAVAAAPILGGVAGIGGALGIGSVGAATAAGAATLASAAQFTGSNLARKMEEGDSYKDASLAQSALASVPQALLDTMSFKMTPGIRKLFGSVGKEISDKTAEQIAKQGLLATTGRLALSGGKTAAIEGSTEAAQQVFERLQAGLNLTDEKAREEYFDNFVGGAVLGTALGGFGHAFDKAKSKIAEQKQTEETEEPPPTTKPQDILAGPNQLQLPAPSEEYVAPPSNDPLRNPLGNFTKQEAPEIYDYINQYRTSIGKPKLPNSFSIEDIADAGAPKQALDYLVANKSGYNGEQLTAQDVLNRAQQKNIDFSTEGFRGFLRRATGSEDINTMSPPQLFAAAKALDSVKPGEEQRILEPGTNALHHTPDQYNKAISGVNFAFDEIGNKPLGRQAVLNEIKDFSGLTQDKDANRILDKAVEDGHLDRTIEVRNVNGKETNVESFTPGKNTSPLPAGMDIREESFKRGEMPEAYDVTSGKAVLSSHDTAEEAEKVKEQHIADRTAELKSRQKEIDSLNKSISARNRELVKLQSVGEGDTFDFFTKSAEADAKNKEDQAKIDQLKQEQSGFAQPVEVAPRGTKPKEIKTQHVLYENDQPIAKFDDQYQAERHGITRLSDETLQRIVDSAPHQKGLLAKRYVALAKDELAQRKNPELNKGITTRKGLEGIEGRLAGLGQTINPRLQEQVEALRKTLLPALKRFGLEKVGLRIVDSIMDGNADGVYTKNLITIAMSGENPMGTLRHETIHALKSMGAFTDAEWKTLQRMAKNEWIGKFIGSDQRKAYAQQYIDSYHNMNGFEEYLQEEAIAEAFKHFAGAAKPPAGLIANLMHRLNGMFRAIKSALTGQGFKTADEIFTGIEEGQYAPEGAASGAPRYSLSNESNQDRANSLNEMRVSPRLPTSPKSTENIFDVNRLQPSLEASERDPVQFEKNVNLMSQYPNFKGLKGTPKEKVEQMIKDMEDNLLWLYDHWKPEYRERSRLWYVGGNRISHRWAKKFGIDPHQVAGVIAALSPQKDWFQNVSIAERILEATINQSNTPWTSSMTSVIKNRLWGTKMSNELKFNPSEQLARFEGKTLREMYDPSNPVMSLLDMAVWIRAWDEANNPQKARVMTPEGSFANEFGTSNKGEPIALRAQSFNAMIKSLKILTATTPQQISEVVGANHKVRSFYNNIIAPYAGDDVTIDTHAVAAALLRPLGSSDTEVGHNFGSYAPSSAITGMNGTYGIYAEAYRRAAEKAGILPREMQSITWEAVRGLFKPSQKTVKTKAEVDGIWEKVANKELGVQDAREQISKLVGGITDPAWIKHPVGSNEAAQDSSYSGELSTSGQTGRTTESNRPGGEAGSEVGARFSLKTPTTPESVQVNGRKIPVTLHPVDAKSGYKIVNVKTDAFDEAFKKNSSQYIGLNGSENAIGKRYENIGNFLKTAKSMEASNVHVKENGIVVFGDGRHRYAYLRDSGLKTIPVAMDDEAITNAKANNLLANDQPFIRFSLTNAPPSRLTKTAEVKSAGKVISDAVDTVNNNFHDDNYWTSLRNAWVDSVSGLTQSLKNLPVFDSHGRLRADMLLRAKGQMINLIKNGLQSGHIVVGDDGSLVVKASQNNLARSLILADKLDSNDMVKQSGMSGRDYIAEIARALRGKDIMAEDAGLRHLGAQQLAQSKALRQQARGASGSARDRLIKNAYRLHRLGKKNAKMRRELQVDSKQLAWAEKQYKQNPAVKEILDIWKDVNHSLVTLWEKTGLLSAEDAVKYRNRDHYVPLFASREDLEPDSFFKSGTGAKTTRKLKQLEGSEYIRNIWENLDKHYAAMTASAYENQTRKVATNQLVDLGLATISNSNDKRVNLRFKENGRDVHAILENPNDLAAFQMMGQSLNPVMKAFGFSTKVLRAGALLNPMYWIKQLVRDPLHASLVAGSGIVTPFHSARAFMEILSKNSEEAKILAQHGVIGSVDSTVSIHDFLKEVGKEKTNPKHLDAMLHKVMQIHEASDAATRVEIYKKAYADGISKGMSKEQATSFAVYKARESINFATRGNSPVLNQLRHMIPFLSASITSLDTVYRAATGYGLNPAEKAEAQRIFRARAMMMVAMASAYAMMYQDDEEYKNLPNYVKDNNWLIPSPTGKGFIKIPTPFEVGFLFKAIPEMGIRYMSGNDTGKEVLAAFKSGLLQNLPGGGIPIPQAGKPILESIANYSFFTGHPIEGMSDQGLPVANRGARASEFAKTLSAYGLDKIGMSPAKIDNLMQGYFAELGTFSTSMADQIIYSAEGKEPPAKNIENLPFMKSFMTDPNVSKAVSDFYDIEAKAKQTAQEFTDLKSRGLGKEAKEYISDEENKKLVQASPTLRKIGEQMTKIRKQMNVISENQNLDPEVRRERLNELNQVFNKVAAQGYKVSQSLGLR